MLLLLVIMVLIHTPAFSNFSHTHSMQVDAKEEKLYDWELANTEPFDELILSWNGLRPQKGGWVFWVSLKKEEAWSDWLKYAEWGASNQKTFSSAPKDSFAKTFQDAAFSQEGPLNGFRIKVEATDGATLEDLHSLFACLSETKALGVQPVTEPLASVLLEGAAKKSQMILDHPRKNSLCSPTALSSALEYLTRKEVDPIDLAEKVKDQEFDIYGNWILNTAEAYQTIYTSTLMPHLGGYAPHVVRLNDFKELYSHLAKGLPVVVSIRGRLTGAPMEYKSGHLICLIGYDQEKNSIIAIDPAFDLLEKTEVLYPLEEFLQAWSLRGNIAYLFAKPTTF